MTLTKALLVLLLGLRAPAGDPEAPEARAARLERVAGAVAAASAEFAGGEAPRWPGGEAELAALLVAVGYEETGFAERFHELRCREGECDSYRVAGELRFRAKSPWQLHSTRLTQDEWPLITGADEASTRLAARAAARVLTYGRGSCGSVDGAISIYATGRTCRWKDRAKRVRMFLWLEQRLEAVIATGE